MSRTLLPRRTQVRRGTELMGMLALLLLHGPALASAVWANAGMLPLRDGLLTQANSTPGDFPFLWASGRGAIPDISAGEVC